MSPVELIEEVVGLLALRANQNGIQIEIDIARNMPPLIRSDFLRLKQILINILSNAIKFSQKSIVNIRETVIDRSDKKLLAIEVEDHGIGITPENQSKLFQPFIQADSTMARRFGGSGIGLSLSRKIAQALGGDIEIISSDIGKGSTFLITCPLQEVTSQAATATANDGFFTLQQAAAKNRTPIVVTKKITANREHRILVAEDSPDNQLMIKTLLKGESFVIDFANDGAEAIRMGTSNNYDLILMDIQMPIMDGYAATRHLRKMGVNTPILALTAHASTDDRNRCLAAGCNNYLTKPISIDHLQNVIRSYT
jgi:CheY-like chemotaxis protein